MLNHNYSGNSSAGKARSIMGFLLGNRSRVSEQLWWCRRCVAKYGVLRQSRLFAILLELHDAHNILVLDFCKIDMYCTYVHVLYGVCTPGFLV